MNEVRKLEGKLGKKSEALKTDQHSHIDDMPSRLQIPSARESLTVKTETPVSELTNMNSAMTS